MRQRHKRWAFLATLVLVVAVVAIPALARSGVEKSTSDVYWFADPGRSVGHSHLWRSDDGVRMIFKTSELAPREAITIWWVIFNEPENCSAPGCGEDDIFVGGDPSQGLNLGQIDAADILAGYATGEVASSGGQAKLHATLGVDEGGIEVIFGDGTLLKDAHAAEIHLVARSHGPAIDGLEDEQTGSYAGGCQTFLNPPEIPDAEGECADIQFAVHLP